MSQFRAKIKTCLQTITRSIKQLPEDKQAIMTSRVSKVLHKYSNEQSSQVLHKFQKQLQFNLNFIKLSYPNINFNPEQAQKVQEEVQAQKVQEKEQQSDSFEEQFQLQNAQALKKQMKDISGVRQEVQFSNWSQGNLDPQNLKRHKQLLTRQHFGGQYWSGKQRPKMQTVQTLKNMIQNKAVEPPRVTQKNLQKKQKVFVSDPAQAFQKVKR